MRVQYPNTFFTLAIGEVRVSGLGYMRDGKIQLVDSLGDVDREYRIEDITEFRKEVDSFVSQQAVQRLIDANADAELNTLANEAIATLERIQEVTPYDDPSFKEGIRVTYKDRPVYRIKAVGIVGCNICGYDGWDRWERNGVDFARFRVFEATYKEI